MTTKHPWEQSYEEAILETDFSQLENRIKAAEQAYPGAGRIQELAADHNGTKEERYALNDAIAGLRFCKRRSPKGVPRTRILRRIPGVRTRPARFPEGSSQ